MSVQLRIARSAEELCALEPLWTRCYDADPYATVFQRFAWNRAAAIHLADRERPHVIAAEDDAGNATVIPAALADGAATFLGEMLADYRSCLTTDSSSESFHACWQELASLGVPLRFTALRPEHHDVFDRFSTNDFVGAPMLSRQTPSEFISRHNRMFSRLRKLERLGFSFTERSAADQEFLRWLYGRKAEADSGGLFHDPARVQLLLDVYDALAEYTQVATLQRGDECIAAVIAFRDRGVLRFYTNWYQHDWAHYSPGMVLLYESTRRALAAGLACDYMTGDQPYKLRLASEVAPLRRLDAKPEELRAL